MLQNQLEPMIRATLISVVAVSAILFASSSGLPNLGIQKASAFEDWAYFLKVDGITGDGPDGSIPVEIFSWGGQQSCPNSQTSGGQCSINWGDMNFHLRTTLATPQLFGAFAKQTTLKSATLYIVSAKANSLKNPTETITIVDPMITSFDVHNMQESTGVIVCAGITFHFDKITFTSYGSNGQTYTTGWDLTTNQPF